MSPDSLSQLALFLFEALVVCGLLLAFFRLRGQFGYAPLYITLGTFQHLQTLMAATLYVEVLPGLVVSPGSAILFTATLFAVLLVYIRDDAAQARSLIVGVVASNLAITAIILLASLHLSSPLLVGGVEANAHLTMWNPKTFVVGTGMLVIDVVMIIVLYEFFYRVFPKLLLARTLAAMLIVVVVDTVVFVTISFYDHPSFFPILTSGLIGKSLVAVVYSLMLTGFLMLFRVPAKELASKHLHDVFHILTYKQRYELLEEEVKRDGLTGLYNRAFFDDNLKREIERAERLQHNLNVILIDIDHFKNVNDTYGHQVGDDGIRALAESMQLAFRNADILCRYGGEEFVVIMPDSSVEAAYRATSRLQEIFSKTCTAHELPFAETATFTAGIASYPKDGNDPGELLRMADERLYKGKQFGRNQVMADTLTLKIVRSS